MSTNDPIHRQEVELRLENVEQRLENKLDRLISAVSLLETSLNSKIESTRQDLTWLTRITMGVLFLLLGIVVAAAIKWVLH